MKNAIGELDRAAAQRKWRAENPARVRAHNRRAHARKMKWQAAKRKANRQHFRELDAKWRRENPDKDRAKWRRWYTNNRESALAARRARYPTEKARRRMVVATTAFTR